jgi:hypothetical protein
MSMATAMTMAMITPTPPPLTPKLTVPRTRKPWIFLKASRTRIGPGGEDWQNSPGRTADH